MNTLKKTMNLSSNHSDLPSNNKHENQIAEEEIKRKCEACLTNYKKQLDDYITARENLCFEEFITFGTNLTHSRLEFARKISSKLGEYLTDKNIFYESNLNKLLYLTKKMIELNIKKTDEFLIIANPGKLHQIMESAQKELEAYCSQIQPKNSLQSSLIPQVNEPKKTILSTLAFSKVNKEAKNQSSNRGAKNKLMRPPSPKKRRIMSLTAV